MPRSSEESTLSSSFSSVVRELENLLLPAPQYSGFGVEGTAIAIIDITSSLKMEHTSTDGRGGASKYVIPTGVIPIHHIRVGNGNGAGSRNDDDADDSIVSSSSSLYWGRTTK